MVLTLISQTLRQQEQEIFGKTLSARCVPPTAQTRAQHYEVTQDV